MSKVEQTKSGIKLSSGRELYANRGLIGINLELETGQGYDGHFPDDYQDFSKEERIEVADYMIELWTRFKEVPC